MALATTLYTNPLTIVPLYLLAYGYGSLILGDRAAETAVTPFEWDWSLSALGAWAMSLGKPLAIGLVALAVTLALLGYVITELGWRAYIVTAWRRRAARRRSAS